MSQKGFAPVLVILVVLVLGAVGYFVFSKGIDFEPTVSTPYDNVFKSQPEPVAVKPVKSETSKIEVITEKGGVLNLKEGQLDVTLSLPEDALLSPEEIGIHTIKSIDGLPEGSKFIAGVELTPDGLGFANSSILKFKLPKDISTENLAAFAYEEGGQNFYFTPYTIKGGVVEVSINGFSGGGIIDIPGLIPIINPGTSEQTAKQLLADVVHRAKGNMTPELLQEARGILNAWYYQSVKPDLRVAEKDDAKVDGAIKQMLIWRAQVHLFVLDEYFQKEFEESLDSSARGVKHGVYQSDKRCINQKDPKQVAALLRWLKMSQLLGLDGRDGLKEQDIQKRAKKCLVFEIKMDSTLSVPSLGMKVTGQLTGLMELSDDFTHFEGGGTVTDGGLTWGNCHSQSFGYDFDIKDTTFNINLNEKSTAKIDLILDLSRGERMVPVTCSPPVAPFSIAAAWSSNNPEDEIVPGFPAFHEDELVSGTKHVVLLRDWEIVGSKEVYARKVYKRAIVEGTNEDTTFILKHTPRK